MGSNFVSAITSHNDALGFQQLGLETKEIEALNVKQSELKAKIEALKAKNFSYREIDTQN